MVASESCCVVSAMLQTQCQPRMVTCVGLGHQPTSNRLCWNYECDVTAWRTTANETVERDKVLIQIECLECVGRDKNGNGCDEETFEAKQDATVHITILYTLPYCISR